MKTFGTIEFDKDKWVIHAEPHVNMRLKDLFRKINKSRTDEITISHSDLTCKDIAWFMERYPLAISETDGKVLRSGVTSYDTQQADLESILLPNYKPRPVDLKLPLRNYQSIAVDLLIKRKRLLCGDDLGLGKTVVALGGIKASGALPALIVCQSHLPRQWKEQIEKFLDLRVHIVKSRRMYSLPEADIYIMGYSKLMGWNDIFRKGFFKFVAFDEIQEMRISGSEKYRSGSIAAERAEYVLGLSATPIYNYGGEIYSVMNLLSEGCLGNWQEFVREWCVHGFYSDNKVRVKEPAALGAFLRENYLFLRRTRKDVGKELQEVNRIVHEVEYNEEYAERAKVELKEIAARVLTGSFVERGQAARQLDAQAREMTGVAKAKGVSDYVKLLLEAGEKVLLVGWHRRVYEIWLQELADYNPVMYTGSETPAAKDKAKKAFVSGESSLMVMSLRSGVGLDGLQEVCNTVVFGELDWSPGVHEQVKGRLNRDGQQEQVMAIFLTTPNGTDPLMVDVLGLKSSQAHGIVNPGEEILAATSDEERIKDLAKRIIED